MRRFATAALVLGAAAATSCARTYENQHPVCDVRPPTILMAESVKTASKIPCVRSLPAGWAFESFEAHDGEATFGLDADAGGAPALRVTLRPACPDGGTQVTSNVPGTRLTKVVRSTDPYAATWNYRFEGGCAVLAISFVAGAPVRTLLADVESGLSFLSRSRVDETLGRRGAGHLDPATA